MVRGMDPDELQRAFFDAIYTYRIPLGIAAGVFAVGAALVAWRLGWFGAARRHPVRAGILLVAGLAIALPLGYYVASPLWIRTELIEPDPVAVVDPPTVPIPPSARADIATPAQSPATPRPDVSAGATPSAALGHRAPSRQRVLPRHRRFPLRPRDRHDHRDGARRLHAPPRGVLGPKRAGPVRLPVAQCPRLRRRARSKLGRLKATDGAFGYELPPGTDPADFASAIIWCKQFSHLFAVAPLEAI